MTQLETATLIAKRSFAEKKDMAGKPYFDHLERIYEAVRNEVPRSEDLQCIALLHDLLEDCKEWNEKSLRVFFSNRIVDAVVALTHKPEQSYDEYIKQVNENSDARFVKVFDLKDNMNITRLPKLEGKDWIRLQKYHKAYNFLKGQ